MDGRMSRLAFACSAMLLVGLACTAYPVLSRGMNAGRLLAAQDDPAQLTKAGLDDRFDRASAEREIDAALAGNDPELAESFVALAQERGVALDPERLAKVEAAGASSTSAANVAVSFGRGLVTGETDSVAAFAGTALGDLFVFGDLRDAARQGILMARGEPADRIVLGLSLAGIAITAGTYVSLGATAPVRLGLSVMKAAGKSGRIGAGLLRAVRLERAETVIRTAGDVGRVQRRAGPRAAIEGLKLAEQPKDLGRLAQLAALKGGKTRAVLKLLGRGAIALTTGVFELASWVVWAILHLLGFCVAVKRTTERITLSVLRRRKAKRERHLARARAGDYRRGKHFAGFLGRTVATARRAAVAPAADR
jgi:hypothetical protein